MSKEVKEVEIRKTGVMRSHNEALLAKPKSYRSKTLCPDYDVRGTEDVLVNGKICKKSVVRTVSPADNFRGLKASDFALENIIAVGALDSLKECQLHVNSTSELADSMEGTVGNIIDAVDEAEASSQLNDGGNE